MLKHRITVRASTEYDVLIGKGLLEDASALILEVHPACECVIVSDDTVYSIYGADLTKQLEAAGFTVGRFVFPHGEESKCTDTLLSALEAFHSAALTRSGLVIALGGGVVGDLAGLAASLYMRGTPFIQIPTTLLAAIDSSVGGKTAVNAPFGKNLIGAFHQPLRVICDPDTLSTLPHRILCDGMAEAIKYGALESPSLLDSLSDSSFDMDDMIAECISIKARVVEADELDLGLRAILNLGHTPAHAIEALSGYTISHGQAVGIGLDIIARASVRLGADPSVSQRIAAALAACELYAPCPFGAEELANSARSDKKRKSDKISLVLLKDIGAPYVHTVELDELKGVLIP